MYSSLQSIIFDRERFIEFGIDLLDSRTVKPEEVRELADELAEAFKEQDFKKLKPLIDSHLAKIESWKMSIRSVRTNYDFYRWGFDNYFGLSTDILFNGVHVEKLSMGQKGTVLLKLFLAEGENPLVIDQPEESLDNKFVYTELVDAVKNAKAVRQIIIATNNANLVVNTDAEQVIVAEYVDNVISYRSGTLEDTALRSDLIPILEGGEEAFKKREQKYGL